MRGLATAALLIIVLSAVAPLAGAQEAVQYRAREPVSLHGDVGVDVETPFVAHYPADDEELTWSVEADGVTIVILTCTRMGVWGGCNEDARYDLKDARVWTSDADAGLPLMYRAADAEGSIVGAGGNVTSLESHGDSRHGSPGMLPSEGYVFESARLRTDVEASTLVAELYGGTVHWEGEDRATGDDETGSFSETGPYGGVFGGYRYVEVHATEAEVETAGPGAVVQATPTLTATDGATLTLAGGSTPMREVLTLTVTDHEIDEGTGDRWLLLDVQLGAALVPTTIDDGANDDGPLGAAGMAALTVAGLGGLGLAAWYSPYLRWLATAGALPLYSRIKSGEVMDHETREEIYALVQEHPGIHAQEIRARTGVGWGTAVYHLKLLEEHKLVVSERQGRYKRFFLTAGYTGRKKEVYGVLRNESTAKVAHFVSAHPGCIQRDVCKALDMSPSLVTWHIKKLEEAELVKKVREGRRVHYYAGPGWENVDLTDSQLALAQQTAASG